MAEGTLQILGLGTSAVPLDYQVAGNQPLDLLAVKADFDGTSAGSDFVPVVEILSDASHVMVQSQGSTVTAGGSATVTFAPFLRSATGSAPPSGGGEADTYSGTPASFAPNGGGGLLSWDVDSGPTVGLLDLTTPTVPVVKTAGTYSVSVSVNATTNMTAGGSIEVFTQIGGTFNSFAFGWSQLARAGNLRPGPVTVVNDFVLAVGDTIQVTAFNLDAINNVSIGISSATVVKW